MGPEVCFQEGWSTPCCGKREGWAQMRLLTEHFHVPSLAQWPQERGISVPVKKVEADIFLT